MTYMHLYVLLTTSAAAMAGYAGSTSSNGVGGSGDHIASGYGYSFSGSGNSPGPLPHQFYQQLPFDFSNFLAGSYAYSSVSIHPLFQGTVSAQSSISFAGLKDLQTRIQSAAGSSGGYGGGFAFYNGQNPQAFAAGGGSYSGYGDQSGYPPVNRYAPIYPSNTGQISPEGVSGSGVGGYGAGGYGAGASASIGGGKVHQTAYLNPENPVSPNVDVTTRNGNPESGGSYSIFTSSSSGFGNVGDKPVHFRQASTTINDNGKVTTYTVRDRK